MDEHCCTSHLSERLSSAWKRSFRRRLLSWYAKHRRDLPWRRSSDPYHVWISEIMLQQTQVATVIPYYARFLESFPNIEALADASEQDVLRRWEGLGYYRRPRQLHRAARIIVQEHRGVFPRDFQAIRSLPGVGRYTAGAIASIAFDQPAPILEANTVRFLSRLVGYTGDAATPDGQRLLWAAAENLLPRRAPGTFNQALMELGSLICSPRQPDCGACPVATLCEAHRLGKQQQIPAVRPKARVVAVHEAAVIVWRDGKLLLRQRVASERWAGLWDFLRFSVPVQRGRKWRQHLVDEVHRSVGMKVELRDRLVTMKHGVTRFRITLHCYQATYLDRGRRLSGAPPIKWLRPAELTGYPLSTTGRKIARLLCGEKPGG